MSLKKTEKVRKKKVPFSFETQQTKKHHITSDSIIKSIMNMSGSVDDNLWHELCFAAPTSSLLGDVAATAPPPPQQPQPASLPAWVHALEPRVAATEARLDRLERARASATASASAAADAPADEALVDGQCAVAGCFNRAGVTARASRRDTMRHVRSTNHVMAGIN